MSYIALRNIWRHSLPAYYRKGDVVDPDYALKYLVNLPGYVRDDSPPLPQATVLNATAFTDTIDETDAIAFVAAGVVRKITVTDLRAALAVSSTTTEGNIS